MSIKQNNATAVSRCNQRLKALGQYAKAKTPMQINGQPMKPADVIGVYQGSRARASRGPTSWGTI